MKIIIDLDANGSAISVQPPSGPSATAVGATNALGLDAGSYAGSVGRERMEETETEVGPEALALAASGAAALSAGGYKARSIEPSLQRPSVGTLLRETAGAVPPTIMDEFTSSMARHSDHGDE